MDMFTLHDSGMLLLVLTELLGLTTAAISLWVRENRE